jgi:hypothetical protein
MVTHPKSLAFGATPGFGGDFEFSFGFGGDKTLAFGGDTKRPTFGGDEHKHIEKGGDKQPAPSFFAVLVVTAPRPHPSSWFLW